MNQQVIIELMNLIGKTDVAFSDLKVKKSPHDWPQRVNRVTIENRNVKVDVDGTVSDFEALPEMIKNTIGQRMRLLFNQTHDL